MKSLIGLALFFATQAYAAPNIVCSLAKKSDRSDYVSAKIVIGEGEQTAYPSGGIDIGKYNYSFVIELEKTDKGYSLCSTFQENNVTQDEVGQQCWDLDLKKAKKGKPIAVEPITDDNGKEILKFTCYYNK